MFYWVLEYGKVLAVYLIVMYLWPCVVFRGYLNKKGLAFRFSFCTTFMILLINTVVLMLGLLGLLQVWVIRALFYGLLVYLFGTWVYRNRDKAIYIRYLLTDICSLKRFVLEILEKISLTLRNCWKKLIAGISHNLPLCILLALIVLYGMIYFSHGAFQERYYGATDIYVHHSWIDMLQEGRIFGAGIYPEGMHCFIYGMNAISGVEGYTILMFLAGIHISAFLLSVYLFFREIFPWKYSGALVLVLYLILELDSAAHVGNMSRLQWTIPQEFALFSVFLCAAYLLRFLRSASAGTFRWRKWELLRDENLLIFLMALAVSIAVHFYATIMAFFLCLAIGIFFLVWALLKKKLIPLLLAILCGVVIAAAPMLMARVSGIEFQGSIDWAMSVIAESQTAIEKKEEELPVVPEDWNPHWEIPETLPEEFLEMQPKEEPGILEKFYENSFAVLYSHTKAAVLLGCLLLGLLLGALFYGACRLRQKTGMGENIFSGYLILPVSALIFMLLFAAPKLGMLELVQIGRLGTMTHMLTIAMVMIPLDLAMTLLSRRKSCLVMDLCAAALCVGICVGVIATGNYHGYLYYVATRYTSAAELTGRIVQYMEPDSFTIVSPVDELYQIKSYGFHEESVHFIHQVKEDSYTLPTEYVFVFVEKRPLLYAHEHLLEGSSWLADERYLAVLSENTTSQGSEVLHSEISEEAADSSLYIPEHYVSYKEEARRTAINSQL